MDDAEGLVYASVAFWEYGCCGELPGPGAHVSGTLSAVPARPTDRFVITAPFAHVADLELLRFDTWSAALESNPWRPDDTADHRQVLLARGLERIPAARCDRDGARDLRGITRFGHR